MPKKHFALLISSPQIFQPSENKTKFSPSPIRYHKEGPQWLSSRMALSDLLEIKQLFNWFHTKIFEKSLASFFYTILYRHYRGYQITSLARVSKEYCWTNSPCTKFYFHDKFLRKLFLVQKILSCRLSCKSSILSIIENAKLFDWYNILDAVILNVWGSESLLPNNQSPIDRNDLPCSNSSKSTYVFLEKFEIALQVLNICMLFESILSDHVL